MHYSPDPANVLCDVFKPGGKWYERIALDMHGYYSNTITPVDAVVLSLLRADHYKIGQWNFYVPEPYHLNAYPVMIPSEEITSSSLLISAAKKSSDYYMLNKTGTPNGNL